MVGVAHPTIKWIPYRIVGYGFEQVKVHLDSVKWQDAES